MAAIRIKELDELKSNKYYLKYHKQKENIRKKYTNDMLKIPRAYNESLGYGGKEQEEYRKYIKELCDLLLEPNGWYQKFTWDAISDKDKEDMERRARGRKSGADFNYY
jgi:hypothetical protein